MSNDALTFAAWCLFYANVGISLLVLWLGPTWAKHYVAFRKEGRGRFKASLAALSLTVVPLPRIDL